MTLIPFNSIIKPSFRHDDYHGTFLQPEGPSWLDTLGAQLEYRTSPLFNRVAPVWMYGRDTSKTGYFAKKDPGYNPFDDDFEGFEEHKEFLIENAVNADHMYRLKNFVLKGKEYRQTLADSSIFNQFTAGLFDPVNFIALPFGGPTIGIARSAMRVGAGVGVLSIAEEAGRVPFDPLNQSIEAPLNIGIGIIGGGILGGLTGILPTRRAKAIQNMQKEADKLNASMGSFRLSDYKPKTERVAFKNITDESLNKLKTDNDTKIKKLEDEITNLETEFKSGLSTKTRIDTDTLEKVEKLKDDKLNLEQTLAEQIKEKEFRTYDQFIDGNREIKIDSNWAADSLLYNMVSVPFRRILNSDAPNSVKMIMLKLGADNGVATTLTRLAIALSPSVYAKSGTRMGQMYTTLAKLTNDWADHGKKGTATTKGNYNYTNFEQRAKNLFDRSITDEDSIPAEKLTLQQYLKQIDKLRTMGKPLSELTEAQRRSIKTLDSFYKQWRERLEAEGLIGNIKTLNKQLKTKQNDLSKFNKELKTLSLFKKDTKTLEWQSILSTRKQNLIDEIKELEASIKASQDDPNMIEEIFSPRYWNKEAIKKNKQGLKEILEEWYTKNPSVYVFNNKTKQWEQKILSTEPEEISKRADETIKRILNETDELHFDNSYFGSGISKHLKHRAIDIPNKLVYDFIHQDPLQVMRAYISKTAPTYEFSVAFKGKSINQIESDIYIDTLKAGGTVEDAQNYYMNIRAMYDRIVGTAVRNPDRMSYKAANVMRWFAQLNYLGKAMFATVAEPAKLLHDHGIKDTFKGLITLVEAGVGNSKAKMTADEVMIAGEALDIILNSSHMRFMDDLSSNPLRNNIWDKTRDVFFTVNGLAPITNMLKQWDGIVRQHTLIDNSIKLVDGTATDQEIRFLARYGIDKDMAIRISETPYDRSSRGLYFANTEAWTQTKKFKHIADVETRISSADEIEWPKKRKGYRSFVRYTKNKKPIIFLDKDRIYNDFERKHWKQYTNWSDDKFKTKEDYFNFIRMQQMFAVQHIVGKTPKEKLTASYDIFKLPKNIQTKINQKAFNELNKQTNVDQETVDTFRSALSTGVLNTIMMGTPADKPILNDGIVYIPMRIAREFNMKEDSVVKGYARIENGILGLPLQFYSYSLASVAKITGSFVQGNVKNRVAALSSALMLAYMGQKFRTNDYTWEQLSYQDKFMRAFDYSGILSLYSALYYEALHSSLAVGGPDIGMGLINPKFNVTEDGPAETVAGLAGAGPSIFWDYSKNAFTLATGKEIDYAEGAFKFINGDRGTAARHFIKGLPFMSLPYYSERINDFGRAIDRNWD